MNELNPCALTRGVVIQELGTETLVYDTKTATGHCLNETAAFVWQNADGSRSIDELALLVAERFGPGQHAALVTFALDQLAERGLLSNAVPPVEKGISRRAAVRRLGLASAIAVPMIASLTAPAAIDSVSCACVNPGDCITQTSCPSTVNCNGPGVCAP
jgi:hypothetical protein